MSQSVKRAERIVDAIALEPRSAAQLTMELGLPGHRLTGGCTLAIAC